MQIKPLIETPSIHISVVIPTYQRRECVARLLQALCTQTLPPDQYEVIVSIDGSDDGTREWVEQFPAPYMLTGLWQPNRGRAAACNSGIRAASGDVLVLLDDDMEPTPTFLEGHVHAHAQAYASKTMIGVLGAVPVQLTPDSPAVMAYIGRKFNQHLAALAQPDHAVKLRDFYSGNFSIRRAVLLGIGLFDEAFKVYGHEDLELSLRLKRDGVQLQFSAEALAYQHYTKDFAGLARDNIAKGQTALLMARKHPEVFAELKLSTYIQGSWLWRTLRTLLLSGSKLLPALPSVVMAGVQMLEHLRPAWLDTCYRLTLDYCYWLGVQQALGVQPGLITQPTLQTQHSLRVEGV